jgi:hypothetical protein
MSCLTCGGSLAHKRPQALYCSKVCKYNSNKNLDSIANYNNSIEGRAKTMWHNSRARNEIHTITEEWIVSILEQGRCQVTNLPFEWQYGVGKQPFAPSLDQIVPGLGYTPENTRVVVWIYNAAKNIFTDEDVLKMASALTNKDGSLKSQTSKRERRR